MIAAPKQRTQLPEKTQKYYDQVQHLILEIRKRKLPGDLVTVINNRIEALNQLSDTDKALKSEIQKTQSKIVGLLAEKLKIVPINYYRNTWFVLGMTVLGLPMGTALGLSLGNMGLLGLGLPVGMFIGLAMGTRMDKKAEEEGRQLNIEIK
jgi:hypothetical protein